MTVRQVRRARLKSSAQAEQLADAVAALSSAALFGGAVAAEDVAEDHRPWRCGDNQAYIGRARRSWVKQRGALKGPDQPKIGERARLVTETSRP